MSPHVVLALRANAALRGLGGFLTIFAAFLVQATVPRRLGGHARAGRPGRRGRRRQLRRHRPRARGCTPPTPTGSSCSPPAAAAAVTVLAAVFYSFAMAVAVVLVSAVTNALGKVSLDAIIQREVPDSLRASAFARSETMLQLAWVVGGAFGIALPPTGWLGFTVAAALLVLAVGLIVWSLYRGGSPGRLHAVSPDAPTTPVEQRWS